MAQEPTSANVCLDDLICEAESARDALQDFVYAVTVVYDERSGLNLDKSDQMVCAVEDFIRSYRKLYGSPVR